MSLETPEKIRNLQRKLYCKAKAEPAFRFYILYDKICREDVLRHAYALSRANAGAPGVDGTTFEQIDASGVEGWLAGLREELDSRTYRADPVRRATIPKPGGGERPLGIPTIRDRVFRPPPRSCWSRSSRQTSRTTPLAIARAAARSMRSRKRTG
jgi:RNA-directed DNA polymerase